MYYPYLRGKQFELILIRENAQFISDNSFHPIIEPVRSDFKTLLRTIKEMEDRNVKYTIITNPKVGKEPLDERKVYEVFSKIGKTGNIHIGYIVNSSTQLENVEKCLKEFSGYNFSIIHYGYKNGNDLSNLINRYKNVKEHIFIDGYSGKLYRKNFKDNLLKRILIRDGFKKKIRNADYPVSEHFSDLHVTFEEEGMDFFGDFLINGDEYSESGGPAYSVAIHLTYTEIEDDMFIYHFISDRTDSPTDPGGKFLEALNKLVIEINKSDSKIYKSNACQEFIKLHNNKHFPGLGAIKKLSMQHHIELISDFIKRN